MKIEGHFLPCPMRGIVFELHTNKINLVIMKIEGHINGFFWLPRNHFGVKFVTM